MVNDIKVNNRTKKIITKISTFSGLTEGECIEMILDFYLNLENIEAELETLS